MRPKVVVFDLDQTLGDFGQLSTFWFGLQDYMKNKLKEPDFYEVLDMYPNVLRPNILTILKYLKKQKETGGCNKVIIYTNNNGEKKWPLMIKRYLEYKTGTRLFDRTIAAYKAKGKRVESLRTTYNKTYNDLQRCAHLPQQMDVCFVDDLVHPQMFRNNVSYLHIPAYHSSLEPKQMIEQFIFSPMGETLISDKQLFFNEMLKRVPHIRGQKQNPQANSHNGDLLLNYIRHFMGQSR